MMDKDLEKDLKNENKDDLFRFINNDAIDSERIIAPRYSYWQSVFRVFFRKKINIVLLIVFATIILVSFIMPIFWQYDPMENVTDTSMFNLSPAKAMAKTGGFSFKWLFGSGAMGNSILYGIIASSRTSLLLATICAAINMFVGIIMGAVWGYSKTLDSIMMVIYNIIANVPYILLISVLVMILSASFWAMVFALTVTGWLGIAYFIRTQVIIIRDREYNLASKCLGTSTFRIAMKNILPFMVSVIVTLAATEIPSYISYEVFLSYIGLSMSDMSLGKLIYEAEGSMLTPGFEFEFWCPVAVASIITVVLYVVGQNLGDASDPRTHT